MRWIRHRTLGMALLLAFIAITFAGVTSCSSSAQAAVPVPPGLQPGDKYHLIFNSSSTTNGTSSDIAHYNDLVQADADAAGIGASGGVTWRAIASTPTVDARDNAVVGVNTPVYNMNPTGKELVATGFADVWDGMVSAFIAYDEQGVIRKDAWTGTLPDGTAAAGLALGEGSNAWCGRPGPVDADEKWLIYETPPTTDDLQVYALSQELTAPECPGAGVTIPGDANGDGAVDAADYTLWADGFGTTGAGFADGDFNGDSTVDAADYTIWADHFGQTAPTVDIASLADVAVLAGSPLHLPLNGFDTNPAGGTLTFSACSDDTTLQAVVLEGNRSMRVSVAPNAESDFGDMVFELFEGRAQRATERFITLANQDFFDGIIFHRVLDGFVIQGGDPNGNGTGGSPLGLFDDQFHVDLHHNRPGLLSMAKTTDDTNNSQFFVTEVPTRHLDMNHTVFGLLVEGEAVRETISNVPVHGSGTPDTNVVMDEVSIFTDEKNGVLMLKAPEGFTGEANVTVTVTNELGDAVSRSFHVTITPDEWDEFPFLADIPRLSTVPDSTITYPLVGVDVEGDTVHFLDETWLNSNADPNNDVFPDCIDDSELNCIAYFVPFRAAGDPNLEYSVNLDTGELTVTFKNGATGLFGVTVAATTLVPSSPWDLAFAIDYQVVEIDVQPAPTDSANEDGAPGPACGLGFELLLLPLLAGRRRHRRSGATG